MANMGSKGLTKYVENFVADNISTASADGIAWINSSDTGDTAFARAVAAGRGLHVSGILHATANNLIEFSGDQLMFYGQDGFSAVEVLLQASDVSNMAFAFGFNDDQLDDSNTLPVELSGTTFTANAGTFVGLVYDTDADNDDLHCFWVDDSSATSEAIANLRMTGLSPTNSQWLWMRVEIQDQGAGKGVRANFMAVTHTGRHVHKPFDTTVDRDCALGYYLGVENRAATAVNVYVKYPIWEQGQA